LQLMLWLEQIVVSEEHFTLWSLFAITAGPNGVPVSPCNAKILSIFPPLGSSPSDHHRHRLTVDALARAKTAVGRALDAFVAVRHDAGAERRSSQSLQCQDPVHLPSFVFVPLVGDGLGWQNCFGPPWLTWPGLPDRRHQATISLGFGPQPMLWDEQVADSEEHSTLRLLFAMTAGPNGVPVSPCNAKILSICPPLCLSP
jgi:hypothetical protein